MCFVANLRFNKAEQTGKKFPIRMEARARESFLRAPSGIFLCEEVQPKSKSTERNLILRSRLRLQTSVAGL